MPTPYDEFINRLYLNFPKVNQADKRKLHLLVKELVEKTKLDTLVDYKLEEASINGYVWDGRSTDPERWTGHEAYPYSKETREALARDGVARE